MAEIKGKAGLAEAFGFPGRRSKSGAGRGVQVNVGAPFGFSMRTR